MSQKLSDNLRALTPKQLDDRTGVFDGTPLTWRPFNDIAEFNASWPLIVRFATQTFWVKNTVDSNKADLYALRGDKTPYKVLGDVDLSNYYTKSETDDLLELKADITYVDTQDELNALAIETERTRAMTAEALKADKTAIKDTVEIELADGATSVTNLTFRNQTGYLLDFTSGGAGAVIELTFNSSGVANLGFTVSGSFRGLLFGVNGTLAEYPAWDDLLNILNLNLDHYRTEVFVPNDKALAVFNSASLGTTAEYYEELDFVDQSKGELLVEVNCKSVLATTGAVFNFFTILNGNRISHYQVTKSCVLGVNTFDLADLSIPTEVFELPKFWVSVRPTEANTFKLRLNDGQTRTINKDTGVISTNLSTSQTPLWLKKSVLPDTELYSVKNTTPLVEDTVNLVNETVDEVVPFIKDTLTFPLDGSPDTMYGFGEMSFEPGTIDQFVLKPSNTGGFQWDFKVKISDTFFLTVYRYIGNVVDASGLLYFTPEDIGLPDLSSFDRIYWFGGNTVNQTPDVITYNSTGMPVNRDAWFQTLGGEGTFTFFQSRLSFNYWFTQKTSTNPIVKSVNKVINAFFEYASVNANNLRGKIIYIIGDSISTAEYAGNNSDSIWWRLLEDYYGCIINVNAISGTPIASHPSLPLVIPFCDDTRLASIGSDADIIIIFGGANDLSLKTPIGTINDLPTTKTTLHGALKYIYEYCLTNFKKAKVVHMTTLHLGGLGFPEQNPVLPAVADITLKQIVDTIKEEAERYGVAIADTHNYSGITYFNMQVGGPYTLASDRTHPNAAGNRLIFSYMGNFLNNLFISA